MSTTHALLIQFSFALPKAVRLKQIVHYRNLRFQLRTVLNNEVLVLFSSVSTFLKIAMPNYFYASHADGKGPYM